MKDSLLKEFGQEALDSVPYPWKMDRDSIRKAVVAYFMMGGTELTLDEILELADWVAQKD